MNKKIRSKTAAPEGMTKTEFGKRLRQARLGEQWGQRELAQAADLPVSQISNFERGFSLPRLETLVKLRGALGCGWGALLGRECGCGEREVCDGCQGKGGKDKTYHGHGVHQALQDQQARMHEALFGGQANNRAIEEQKRRAKR